MNFGEIVKSEAFYKPPKTAALKKAFLSGVIRGNGTLYETENGYGLFFKIVGEDRAIAVTDAIKSAFGVEVREVAVQEDNRHHRDTVKIDLAGADAKILLAGLRITEEKDGATSVVSVDEKVFSDDETFKAYLRGLFVTAGSCTVPDVGGTGKTGYHLELSFTHSATCQAVLTKLAEHGIRANVIRRKENYVLYLKSAEVIKDFIAFLPAPASVLKFTDIMIERELLNVTNRRKNCDLGNVNRQIEAQEKILKAIENLEKGREFDALKPELKETAAARKKYPEDSLFELAERLKITKSCLNHRLRKIISISERSTENNR